MAKVLLELSVSLDGYVAGPRVGPEAPMGHGGESLHAWMFEGRSAAESQSFETEHFSSIGALIIGRRMADLGIGPWGEEPSFHAPVSVVTHRPAETIVKEGGTSYIFVTEGIDAALVCAREAAGSDDVMVNGGADIARQYLEAGAIDVLRLHLRARVSGRHACSARAHRRTFGWRPTSRTTSSGRRPRKPDRPASRWPNGRWYGTVSRRPQEAHSRTAGRLRGPPLGSRTWLGSWSCNRDADLVGRLTVVT
jgi:dihydrofolate reductase